MKQLTKQEIISRFGTFCIFVIWILFAGGGCLPDEPNGAPDDSSGIDIAREAR